MNVELVVRDLGLSVLAANNNLDREVDGVYICDLLSWVMSNGSYGNIWVTVQTNINIIAIATFVGISCIIIPENIQLDEFIKNKAIEKDVIILSSHQSGYEICAKLSRMLEIKQ